MSHLRIKGSRNALGTCMHGWFLQYRIDFHCITEDLLGMQENSTSLQKRFSQ